MKKLSTVNESLLGGIQKKVMNGEERLEDQDTNIKQIKPVDMGGSVLWADQDLKIDYEYLITYEDFNHFMLENEFIVDKGWRLPHVEDVEELVKSGVDVICDKESFNVKNSYGELIFPRRGFIYNAVGNIHTDRELYYGWTGDLYAFKSAHIFYIEKDGTIYYSKKKGSIIDQISQSKNDRLCVRLVKDK